MSRSVLGFVGAFGPGGAVAILTEKLCKGLFYEGYEVGDPAQEQSNKFKEVSQKQRADFVAELF